MKLEYLLDHKPDSFSLTHTPNLSSLKLPFIVHNFGQFNMGSKYFTTREGLDNYLFFYTLEGNGVLEYRGIRLVICPNQAVLIHCLEHQKYYTGDSGYWKFKWINFNGSACSHYMNLINDNSVVNIQLPSICETVKYMDMMFLNKNENTSLLDLKFSMFMTNIMTELVIKKFNSFNSKLSLQHASIIEKVIKFIKENYNQKLDLDNMSKIAGISKFHLIRIFKTITSITPYEYLINYRIDRAKILLKESEKAIYEISYEIGYNDENNFIRDFKKYVGTTPLKYRINWVQ